MSYEIVRKVLSALAALWILGLVICGYLAYFVTQTGNYDGLGRKLVEAPVIISSWYGSGYWPGWGWVAFDFVLFWGSIAVIAVVSKMMDKWYQRILAANKKEG
jgi:hypothetical protein